MPIERSEYEKLQEAKRSRNVSRETGMAQAQAAVEMGQLLDDPAWAAYQKTLKRQIERLSIQLQKTFVTFLSAKTTDELWQLVAIGREQHGVLLALEGAIALPAEIKQRGEKAAEDMEKSDVG